MSAQREPLSGNRWHLQHGPIDIVIGANGEARALEQAHEAAWQRFTHVLDELVAELPRLREPVNDDHCPLHGVVARRMWQACHPYRGSFITPMAAVAGAVAEELIVHYERAGVARAWANNGGDIALHVAPGESLKVGVFADLGRLRSDRRAPLRIDGDFCVESSMPVRGIATSGWRGRSFSLGIADSVTVLARSAAQADAAATVIANAVNIDDPRIERRPACEMKDGSDLGELLVTVDVPPLGDAAVKFALGCGQRRARELQAAGLIWSAVLVCQGWFATDGAQPQRLHSRESAAGAPLLFA